MLLLCHSLSHEGKNKPKNRNRVPLDFDGVRTCLIGWVPCGAPGTRRCRLPESCDTKLRGCSSMVEQQPSKLNTRVRFPSPAPIFRAVPPSLFSRMVWSKKPPSLGSCSCGYGPLVNLTRPPRPSRPVQETSPANGCRRAHFGYRRCEPRFGTTELSYRCRRQ